jgi:hypothetical protein
MNRLTHLACGCLSLLLAACASSTMDSIPTPESMEMHRRNARGAFSAEFEDLSMRKYRGELTQEQYNQEMDHLEERVTSHAHTLAWQAHEMAERQRKANGEPTPDQPVQIQVASAATGGAGGQSTYRPYFQNFNVAAGIGGTANGPVSSSGLPIRARTPGAGGALARQNYPGTIYDAQR